ncbi:MAG TPA: ABC transporter substrate-binding protein [Candidatus Binataceae bacterium]|nr:ABC transporter substrate-binding protein [Candidatus Binataceae bacterium]
MALSGVLPLAHAADMIPVRVVYVPVATWLPAWVAFDKGLFAKNGLQVTFTQVQNTGILPGTVGKQFDLAPTTATDLLHAAASGLDVVGVAGETVDLSSNQTVQIMVRADSNIKSAKGLEGKRIATPSLGAVMHVATLNWMKMHKADPGTLVPVEVPFPAMMDQLKAGRVDAVEALQPFVGQMRAAGYKALGDPLLSVGDPVLFPFWMAQGQWARTHRDVIEKWIASLTEAAQYIKTNDRDARTILAKYTHLPAPIAEKVPLPTYRFALAPKQLEVWLKVLQSQGTMKQPLDVDKLVVTAK